MTHIELIDTTGARWIGDSSDEELTASDRASVTELLSNFRELNHLSLEIDGNKHYFNPSHIISVSVHEGGC